MQPKTTMQGTIYELYVWEGEGTLTDYTDGLIVCVASSLEEALNEFKKKCSYGMGSFDPTKVKKYPLNEPSCFYTWGGG